jgi:hypothetical protein
MHHQAHNPNNYVKALMSAPPQVITPNPQQIKWSLKKKYYDMIILSESLCVNIYTYIFLDTNWEIRHRDEWASISCRYMIRAVIHHLSPQISSYFITLHHTKL